MAVLRIDRFKGSVAAASAVRGRLTSMLSRRRRGRPSNERAIRIVEILLIAGIGVVLGVNSWLLVSPLSTPPTAPPPRAVTAEPSAVGPINPFRTAGVAPAPVADDGAALAETTLNLVLHGTWIDEKGGVAFIGTGEEKQSRFGIGDEITSGVTLESVRRDQVVILRNGVRESLRLINREGAAASFVDAAVPPPQQPQSFDDQANQADGMASIGHLVVATPELDQIGGMRLVLQPADDPEGFMALGLQSGDVLVAVDNQPIGKDIAQGLQTLALLDGKTSVTISVERDGAVMPVTIALPNTVSMPND